MSNVFTVHKLKKISQLEAIEVIDKNCDLPLMGELWVFLLTSAFAEE